MNQEYLPISKLNTVVFCPRRYYIEHVLSDTHSNHHLAEGSALHERARREGEGLWVWSDRLGLVGVLDKLHAQAGKPVITEFKKGWLGDHKSDQVQLCALALCVEEMRGASLEHGIIFYHRTRRTLRVDFSAELRAEVEEAVMWMRALNTRPQLPPVLENRSKCRGCSVKAACQPELSANYASVAR